jgi:copper transport protein
MSSLLRRLLIVAPLTGIAMVVFAGPASAHAVLEHSSPAADSLVKSSPAVILLSFDETVIAASDAVLLYDDHLHAVRVGATVHSPAHGNDIQVPVPITLSKGTYTVTWRVTSADTHVVSGSFTFSVGKRTPVTGEPPKSTVDYTSETALGVVRGLGYAGLIAGPGALVLLLWLYPAGLGERRMRRVLTGGGALLVVVTVAGFVVQGGLAAGVPLHNAFRVSIIRLGMKGRFGRAGIERLVLLFMLAQAAVIADHDRRLRPPGRSAAGLRSALLASVVAGLLAATWPYAGHASTGSLVPLSFIADWVHVAAVATWLGGVVVLLVIVLRKPALATATAFVASFSEWALAAVLLIVATGLFAMWRNVRSWGALPHTTYGVLLLVKSGVVLVVIAVGYLSRRHVKRLASRGAAGALSGLRRTVVAEAGVAFVVLGVTAALTGTAQAYEVYAPALTRTATDAGITVRVHVDSTRVGNTTLLVSTTRVAGGPQAIEELDGSLTEVSPSVGPLPVTFRAVGKGREVATVTFPDQGDWALQLNVQTSPINAIAVSTTIPVR